jgi:hypothetical protein
VCAVKQDKPFSRKLVYAAVRAGKLRVAHIGLGRNWVTCDDWVSAWLQSCERRPTQEPKR